jgi:hypothetical protein
VRGGLSLIVEDGMGGSVDLGDEMGVVAQLACYLSFLHSLTFAERCYTNTHLLALPFLEDTLYISSLINTLISCRLVTAKIPSCLYRSNVYELNLARITTRM